MIMPCKRKGPDGRMEINKAVSLFICTEAFLFAPEINKRKRTANTVYESEFVLIETFIFLPKRNSLWIQRKY